MIIAADVAVDCGQGNSLFSREAAVAHHGTRNVDQVIDDAECGAARCATHSRERPAAGGVSLVVVASEVDTRSDGIHNEDALIRAGKAGSEGNNILRVREHLLAELLERSFQCANPGVHLGRVLRGGGLAGRRRERRTGRDASGGQS